MSNKKRERDADKLTALPPNLSCCSLALGGGASEKLSATASVDAAKMYSPDVAMHILPFFSSSQQVLELLTRIYEHALVCLPIILTTFLSSQLFASKAPPSRYLRPVRGYLCNSSIEATKRHKRDSFQSKTSSMVYALEARG
jgi:hypothetical protein